MSPWIRVDDFDRRIKYSTDGWRALQLSGVPTDDYDFLNLQDAFLGTTHVVVGTDLGTESSFSFSFDGTGVAVYGMYVGLFAACSSDCTSGVDVIAPNWACSVDGEDIRPNAAFGQFPWQSYCELDGLADGPHTLTAHVFHRNVSVPSGFYLDFIQYLPSLSSLSANTNEQEYLMIDSTDPQIPFTREWTSLGTAKMTLDGGELFLEFTGVLLAWYSLSPHAINTLDPSLLKNETISGGILCQYTIDGQDPVNFMIALGPATLKPNTYNNILLQTATLPAGKHNLSVSGFAFGHPITLDYLIVQQGPLVSDTSASSTADNSASTAPNITETQNSATVVPHGSHPNVKAIVGTVVGAVSLVFLVVFLLVFKRRKISGTDTRSIFSMEPLPAHIQLEPFRDSVDKLSAPASSSHSVNDLDGTTIVPSRKAYMPRLQTFKAITEASPSNSHVSLSPPVPSTQNNSTDQLLNSELIEPSASASSLTIPQTQTSSSSLQPPHLPALFNETRREIPYSPHSSLPVDHQHQDIGYNELDEQDAPRPLLADPVPQSTSRSNGHRPLSRVMRHADSGIRLTRRQSENVLELPPEYTMD